MTFLYLSPRQTISTSYGFGLLIKMATYHKISIHIGIINPHRHPKLITRQMYRPKTERPLTSLCIHIQRRTTLLGSNVKPPQDP